MTDIEIKEKNVEKEKNRGASMVEYALLVVLIAIIAIAAVRLMGLKVSQQFSNVGSAL